MNQILFSKYDNDNFDNKPIIHSKAPLVRKRSKTAFVILLSCSLCVLLFAIIYVGYSSYVDNKRSNLYMSLSNDYSISRLYNNSSLTNDVIVEEEQPIFTVIGIIKIDKIKVSSPILSTIDDELLKIAPCRFAGPDANKIGNLCIAAHNYNDSRFFSNLSKISINDEIQIFDNYGKLVIYKVFDKYETATSDTSCTLPLGNNTMEITLVTCNNLTGNRIIVKAKSMT